jgi:hypothetical protein
MASQPCGNGAAEWTVYAFDMSSTNFRRRQHAGLRVSPGYSFSMKTSINRAS